MKRIIRNYVITLVAVLMIIGATGISASAEDTVITGADELCTVLNSYKEGAAAVSGNTVTLSEDVYVKSDMTVTPAANIILKLDGGTLGLGGNFYVKGGTGSMTITSVDDQYCVMLNSNETAIGAEDSGTLTLKTVSVEAGYGNEGDAIAFVDGGTLNIKASSIVDEASLYTLYVGDDSVCNITDGSHLYNNCDKGDATITMGNEGSSTTSKVTIDKSTVLSRCSHVIINRGVDSVLNITNCHSEDEDLGIYVTEEQDSKSSSYAVYCKGKGGSLTIDHSDIGSYINTTGIWFSNGTGDCTIKNGSCIQASRTAAYIVMCNKFLVDDASFLANYAEGDDYGITLVGGDSIILKKSEITGATAALSYINGDYTGDTVPISTFVSDQYMTSAADLKLTGTNSYVSPDQYIKIIAKPSKATASSLTYTGKVRTPSVSVRDSEGTALKKNIDYTVSGARGKNVGTYTCTFTFQGDYAGAEALQASWQIKPATAAVKSLTSGKRKLTVKATTKPSGKGGSYYQMAYKQKGSSKWKYAYTSSYSKTIKSLKKGKYYYVKVRAYKKVSGRTYYGSWSKTKLSKKIK